MEQRRILLEGTITHVELRGDVLVTPDGREVAPDDAVHLPPVSPTKILCTHFTYRDRLEELGRDPDPFPTYFIKPLSTLNAHGGTVIRPKPCRFLTYEGEIVAVIGRTTRNIRPEDAADHIAGYTIGNDLALQDFRSTDLGSTLRVKGADTLSPVGPGLVTDWDFRGKTIQTLVNDRVVQEGRTDNMIWDAHYLVADLARMMTLHPGDVVFTGTPAHSRPVEPGDTVSVLVEGLGRLDNTIADSVDPLPEGFGAQPTAGDDVLSIAAPKKDR